MNRYFQLKQNYSHSLYLWNRYDILLVSKGGVRMIQKRNIVTCILLSLVTCGIYGIVWFINMTDDVAYLSEDPEMSGGKAFLFTLITCGIYSFFWAYKMGKNVYRAQLKRNITASDNSVLYVILQVFGLGIVNYCLMQNDINNMIDVNQ